MSSSADPTFFPFLAPFSQLEKEAAHIAKKEESEIKHATKALAHAEKSESKSAKVRSLDSHPFFVSALDPIEARELILIPPSFLPSSSFPPTLFPLLSVLFSSLVPFLLPQAEEKAIHSHEKVLKTEHKLAVKVNEAQQKHDKAVADQHKAEKDIVQKKQHHDQLEQDIAAKKMALQQAEAHHAQGEVRSLSSLSLDLTLFLLPSFEHANEADTFFFYSILYRLNDSPSWTPLETLQPSLVLKIPRSVESDLILFSPFSLSPRALHT